MKSFLDNHADMILVFIVSVLLVLCYVFLLANFSIDNEALKTLMIGAVGGLLGMGTKKARNVEVSGDDAKVRVDQ